MAQNGAGGNSTPKPGLVFSLCGQQVLLPLFFIFISYIIKILWPFPEVSALKKKIMRKENSKEKYNSADVRESVP